MRLTFALIAGLGLVLAGTWLVGCQSGPDQSPQSATKFEQPRYLLPQVEPLKPSEKPPEAPAGAPAAPAAGTPAAPAAGTPAAPAAPAATPAAPAAPAAPAPAPEAGK
jgi:nucleoid-associated protein YgaU